QGDMTLLGDKLLVYYTRDDDKKDQKKAAPAAKPEKKAEKKKAGSTEEGLTDAGAKVRKVVAIGHVKITQKDRVGVGRQATYWAGGRKLLLEGQATVWKQKNQVSGEKITVFLDTNRTVVHGRPGRRVSVTIVPGSFNKNQDKK
ncbi:MAG: hypothetical protein KJ921_01120, partial [Proteobacteria bacterium]|nr:hypothetical protein [Pseudomonadota bacterium]